MSVTFCLGALPGVDDVEVEVLEIIDIAGGGCAPEAFTVGRLEIDVLQRLQSLSDGGAEVVGGAEHFLEDPPASSPIVVPRFSARFFKVPEGSSSGSGISILVDMVFAPELGDIPDRMRAWPTTMLLHVAV